ncbi:MAG: hypothetical protein GY765_23310 [bacterium]|nr:hypothetical protein [bacterium]
MPLCAFTYNPVYKDYVVLAPETDKFIIDILDHSGKKVRRIEKTDYEKIAINETYKKATHAWFKNEFYLKQFYERNIKQRLRFRKYYPPIRDIHVNDEVMYVITFKREGELWECIRMDMKGKELGRSFVPLDRYIPYTYHSILYSVDKSKFYSLVEDEEEEVYKLHITDLK